MGSPDLLRLKAALVDAGLEIYGTGGSEIQIAERVRLHIMDSGVRVRLQDLLTVRFTARSQRSDFPHASAEDLFAKVRGAVGTEADTRGYVEAQAQTVQVKDPVDGRKVLDTWHEVTYEKSTGKVDAMVEEVRWALSLQKYIVD